MDRLLFSSPSPFSSKVRMAAAIAGYPLEEVPITTGEEPPVLMQANPLGKIPTLVSENDGPIYDSSTILAYIDRQTGNGVYPLEPAARTKAQVLESLADGICDAMILIVYEKRYRPEEKFHQGWVDLQRRRIERSLGVLAGDTPVLGDRPHGGDVALRAALGYLQLRMPGLLDPQPGLQKWCETFDEKFPDIAALKPA